VKKLLLLIAVAACNPYLQAESAQPPGRSARLDEVTGFWGTVKSYRLELSRGVAIAITCRMGSPCEHMRAVSDNPAIAEVRAASLGVLEKHPINGENTQTSSAMVIVGKSTGTTKIRVDSKEGHREIAVTIIGSPGPTVSANPASAVATDPAAPGT